MDKTININLGGTLFSIDEEAYKILRDYLQSLNNHFRNREGGLETVEDIEQRISEIFLSQKGTAGIISRANVEEMIAMIGRPEDMDPGDPSAPTAEPVRSYTKTRRLYRNPDDQIISGVCGGLGAYLNTDPVLFRILFVLFTVFFGSGILIYIVLWIALPRATSDSMKRELYGNQPPSTAGSNSRLGSALNEIFSAVGRVFFIIFRVFMIIIGTLFVLTGFLAILSFVMVILFKYPGSFSTDTFDMNLIYFPDFLNYLVNPSIAPWIIVLTVAVLCLPMIALIWWGIRMIFWFRVNDGAVNLTGLVLWVLAATALAIILFREGISFAENARTTAQKDFKTVPDTIYVVTDRKISDLKPDKEISLKDEGYTVFINETQKELYIRPTLNISASDDETASVKVTKRSFGRSEMDAMRKTNELEYNFSLSGDTLILDEYFKVQAGRKWAADQVDLSLIDPSGTIIKSDYGAMALITPHLNREYRRFSGEFDNNKKYFLWKITESGFIPLYSSEKTKK